MGKDALAADFAAAEFFRAEDGLFQLWLLGQHGAAKPPADQAAGDVLRANTVQYQAVAIQEVAAALCKAAHAAELPRRQAEERAIRVKYAGYLQRQEQQIEAFRREESRLLPEDADYASIAGLRLEARQKLADIRPRSIGQAGRISGVSPADIAVLLIWLSQRNENSTDHAE